MPRLDEIQKEKKAPRNRWNIFPASIMGITRICFHYPAYYAEDDHKHDCQQIAYSTARQKLASELMKAVQLR